jgi:predicted Zn-dependent protease
MWLSQYLNVAGQHQEALALIRRAQQLDPLSPHIQWSLAETSMLAGAAGLLVRQDASAAESEVTAGILKDARLRMKEE